MCTQIFPHNHIVYFCKLCGILSRPIPIVHSNSTTHMSSPKHTQTQRMVVVKLGKAFRMPLLWHGLLMYVWLTSWKKGYCREMNPHTAHTRMDPLPFTWKGEWMLIFYVPVSWSQFSVKSVKRYVIRLWLPLETRAKFLRRQGAQSTLVPPDSPTPEMLHWHRNGAALLRNFFSFIFLSGRSGDARDISSRKSNYTPSHALCVRLLGAWDLEDERNLCKIHQASMFDVRLRHPWVRWTFNTKSKLNQSTNVIWITNETTKPT